MARPFGTFKYDNLADLEKGIEDYFKGQDEKDKPYTIEGLALSLNISSVTLMNYGREDYADGNYFSAIRAAREKCIAYASERLYDKNGANGAKFYLTNNAERMGGNKYSDKTEFAVTADIAPDPDALKSQLHDLIAGLTAEERAALGAD